MMREEIVFGPIHSRRLGSSLGIKTYLILLAWLALGLNFFTPTVSRS